MRKIKDQDIVAIVLVATMLLFGNALFSQDKKYTRRGNEFSAVSVSKVKSEPVKTIYTWKDRNGNVYPIYQSTKGSYFIIKTSKKTGKTYRQYLPKEIKEDIR